MAMGKTSTISLFLLLIIFLSHTIQTNSQSTGATLFSPPVSVRIGLVLDFNSPLGKICRAVIDMALSDFYSAHSSYTTRLDIRRRNSDGDVVSAAAAVVELMRNDQVHAIIGPTTSEEAEFAADIATKYHIPMISFSATSPTVSHKITPYFVRTAVSDSAQVDSLANLGKAFRWTQVVAIYEDTEYGCSVIPFLVDALKKVDCRVAYRSVLPKKASDDYLKAELYKLKSMQSRVFVVHMSAVLASRLFLHAQDAGMMEEGYAWLMTEGLTSAMLTQAGSTRSLLKPMTGVLGLKHHVPETELLEQFQTKWRERAHQTNPGSEAAPLSAMALWAYDTVWALAIAVENSGLRPSQLNTSATKPVRTGIQNSNDLAQLGESSTGDRLLKSTLSTRFSGLSGKFHLVNGQLNRTTFEIVNIVDEREKLIGFWSAERGLYSRMKPELRQVVWPGKTPLVPKGWVTPMGGKKLKVAVPGPVKPGFHSFLEVERKAGTDQAKAQGFVVEVFEEAVKQLPYPLMWEYMVYQTPEAKSAGSYNDLVHEVYLQKYDAVVGDVTITANRSHYVDFTLPYMTSGVSMVVPMRDDRRKSAWVFLKPLTRDLWVISGAFFVLTGIVVWILEHRVNNEFRGGIDNQIGTVFYFCFSTLVFAHREKMVNNLSKVVMVMWLFVVLILQSSYTASLTSMLTVKQLKPTIFEIEDLKMTKEYVGYLEDSFVRGFLLKMGFHESRLRPYTSPEDYADALAKGSTNGGVGAIIDEVPYLKLFLKSYCSNYTMTGRTHKTGGFGFVLPRGSSLVPDLSRAILNITEGEKMLEIEKKWFGDQAKCSDQESPISSNSLNFENFWGLFLITGIASTVSFMIFLVSFCHEKRHLLLDREHGSSVKEKVKTMIREFDQKDPRSRTLWVSQTPVSTMPSYNNGTESPFSSTLQGTPFNTMQGSSEEPTPAASTFRTASDNPNRFVDRAQGGETPPPVLSNSSPEQAASPEITAQT